MKLAKKIAAIALSAALITGAAACGGAGKNANSATDVQIYFWNSGFGDVWINKTVEEFNAMQDEYHVTVEESSSASPIISSLSLGEDNTYDLYFTMLNTFQYLEDFMPLDEVLDSSATGESVTIRSKYNPSILRGVVDKEGKTPMLTYSMGYYGIIYNKDIIDGTTYKVPRTTNELTDLTDDLAGDENLERNKVHPWLFFNSGNAYWLPMVTAWAAQYDGLDYYYNTLMTLGDLDNPSKEIFLKKDGRYKALKAMEKFITPDTTHPEVTSSNFTKVQQLFLQGESVMLLSGTWLATESAVGNTNIGIMKTPVISSIVEKLEDTSMTDATLAAIVDEVDSGAESSALCSANDFNRIREAREISYCNGADSYVFVPEYSPAKDGSIAFLKYFYSDAGTLAFQNATHTPAPVSLTDESKFDKTGLTEWEKSVFEMNASARPVTNALRKSGVYLDYGQDIFTGANFAQPFCARSGYDHDRRTADQVWAEIEGNINSYWGDWTK